MKQNELPRYTISEHAFSEMPRIISSFGSRATLITGEKAFAACGEKLLGALNGVEITTHQIYGREASVENIERLKHMEEIRNADAIIAAGGGKCLDVAKVVGDQLGKPVFTVPTIASTCAAVTKIAILHYENGAFREIYRMNRAPVHCFIDPSVIAEAPAEYFWAGMGDTMAKHVECMFSYRNDDPDFEGEYGKTVSVLCYEPVIRYGKEAYEDIRNHRVSSSVIRIIESIIIATGTVSLSVAPDCNSALAHALYYGMTVREWMEHRHLHGEIVSYGTLVQLMLDHQTEELKRVYEFNRSVGLPVCLKDLDLERDDPLTDVIHAAAINQELDHIPYPISEEMIRKAIDDLEDYRP